MKYRGLLPKRSVPIGWVRGLALAALAGTAQMPLAVETGGIGEALAGTEAKLLLRYRFENVDQDGFDDDANASTLLSRLTLKTGAVAGLHGVVEVDNVSYLGGDAFNNTENGRTDRPVVADPDHTEVNQAYLSYAFAAESAARVGRQRINHADQRFLGGVGWRQNEQTFDAGTLSLTPLDAVKVDYSYIWRVNRIFGPEGPDADFKGDTHAALVSYLPAAGHTLSAFGYWLDFDEAPALSSATYGARYQGSLKLSAALSLGLQLAAARQHDYADSPLDYDADYWLAEFSLASAPLTVTGGYEVLGSDDGVGFKTPLATLHKFQGFADVFLVTPAGGVEDRYLTLATQVAGVKLAATYHDFEADKGGADYGDELDLVAAYAFSPRYSALLKYAAYDADEFAVDTDKIWLMLTAVF